MNAPERMPVIVDGPCGKLEGTRANGVCQFKGIPFATARRWHAPEAVAPWSGVRSARAQGAVAPQNPTPLEGLIGGAGKNVQSEDCLFLNVWTPSCDGAKRPVMVWVHGGAFVTGAGSLGLYHGARLAALGDVVGDDAAQRLARIGEQRGDDGLLAVVRLRGRVVEDGKQREANARGDQILEDLAGRRGCRAAAAPAVVDQDGDHHARIVERRETGKPGVGLNRLNPFGQLRRRHHLRRSGLARHVEAHDSRAPG